MKSAPGDTWGWTSWRIDCGFPLRGIEAGCAFAKFWVQVYAMDPLDTWQKIHRKLSLTVFKDDRMSDAAAQHEHQEVGRLASGAADFKTAIEEELGCKVAGHKSALIARSDRCKKAFGKYSGTAAVSAPNLGVDVFEGRRRAHRKSINSKLLKSVRRRQALKRAG